MILAHRVQLLVLKYWMNSYRVLLNRYLSLENIYRQLVATLDAAERRIAVLIRSEAAAVDACNCLFYENTVLRNENARLRAALAAAADPYSSQAAGIQDLPDEDQLAAADSMLA